MEAQGGSWDPWGGYGYNDTALRVGAEYERVFYKNYYSFGVKIFSVYMTAGGTNWGNMGYPQGYTSYDYVSSSFFQVRSSQSPILIHGDYRELQ